MVSSNKRIVRFTANEKFVEPVEIEFETKEGEKVKFVANKTTTRPVVIRFRAKKK